MSYKLNVHPFCDICGKELLASEKEKNFDFENFEFPICDTCFEEAMKKIKYIASK